MRRLAILLGLVVAISIGLTAVVAAHSATTTITFNDALETGAPSSYTELGLTVTMTSAFFTPPNPHMHTNYVDTLDSDGAIMIHGSSGARQAEFDMGGNAFDVVSFDLAGTYSWVPFGTNDFVASNGSTLTVTTPGTVVLPAGWTGITSFTWTISPGTPQAVMDNLVIGVEEGKETICHRTNSKKNPAREISVSHHAVGAHLAHGDTLGSC